MAAARRLLPALFGTALLSVLVAAFYGRGRLLNYDTSYSLLWGSELARGQIPDITIPFAPTQHPLATLLGALLTLPGTGPVPHAGAATAAWELLAIVFLGALGYLTFALGRHWFGAGAGVVAAAVLLTREPVLSYGIRAYVDIPYICLLLGALLVESRRPRAGRPVLVLLALAGLLRPEAWLFSLIYLAWLWRGGSLRREHLLWAACAPLLWAASDLIQTGNPIHSFSATQSSAEELGRVTGITNVPATLPRRLGEILRVPGLLAGAGGGLLALLLLRDRARALAAAGVIAVLAFVALAAAGLPILTRYLLGPAAILAIFAGAAVCGWSRLAPDDRRRRPWQTFAALCLLAFAVLGANQWQRLTGTRHALVTQRAILTELRTLAPLAGSGCPVGVPNRRPVPQLALWTGRPAASIRSAQADRRYTLPAFSPASPRIAKQFILNKSDATTYLPPPPSGSPKVRGRWWTLTGHC